MNEPGQTVREDNVKEVSNFKRIANNFSKKLVSINAGKKQPRCTIGPRHSIINSRQQRNEMIIDAES